MSTTLTKKIAEQFLADCHSVDLSKFTSIEDAAAAVLAKNEKYYLELTGLTSLSDAAAEMLTKQRSALELRGEVKKAFVRVRRRLASQKAMKQTSKARANPAPPQYREGRLNMPPPEKPVKGAGYERLRWRKDGSLENHDKPTGSGFEEIDSGLQRWFYELLPELHSTKQKEDYWVTSEAWRVFIDHLDFWREEWEKKQKEKAEKAAGERAKVEKKLAESAVKAGFKKSELKAKLSRLKQMMRNGDQALAAQLIMAGDPWLLESVLAGARVKKARTDYGVELECDQGPFFKGEDEFVFWVAVAQAKTAGCCPRSIALEDVFALRISAKDEAQVALLTGHVLPALEGLQELTLSLSFEGCRFSTAELPLMPVLSRLVIDMDDKSRLTVQALDRQISLRALFCQRVAELDVDENQVVVFDRVRLEIPQGGHSVGRNGLRDIKAPPESYGDDLRQLNTAALRILLNMQRDHSLKKHPPAWWCARWNLPDVRARVSGEIKDFQWPKDEVAETYVITVVDTSGNEHQHEIPLGHEGKYGIGGRIVKGNVLAKRPCRILDLSGLETLSVEQAALIAEASVPVRVNGQHLTAEVGPLFKNFSGELHVAGEYGAKQLAPLMGARGALFLESGDGAKPLPLDAALELSRFRGATLCVHCNEPLGPERVKHLASFAGELRLMCEGGRYSRPVELGVAEAKILVEREAPVRLGDGFGLSVEAIEILTRRTDIDLREYRRCFRQAGKQGESTVTLERCYSARGGKPHLLRTIRCMASRAAKVSEKTFTVGIDFGSWVQRFLADGWEEVPAASRAQSKAVEQRVEKAAATAGLSRPELEANPDRLAGLAEQGDLKLIADMVAGFDDPGLFQALLAGASISPEGDLKSGKPLKRFKEQAELILLLAVAFVPEGVEVDASLRRDAVMNVKVSSDNVDIVAEMLAPRLPGLKPSLRYTDDLGELSELKPATAALLARLKESLYLNGLKVLSDAAAEALAKHEGDLSLGGLTGLSEAAAEALGQHVGDLELGLKDLPEAIATRLAAHQGGLEFPHVRSISPAAAAQLEKHTGELSLGKHDFFSSGLVFTLSADAARHLGRHTGPLCFPSLKHLDPEVALALSAQQHGLKMPDIEEFPPGRTGVALCERLAETPGDDLSLIAINRLEPACAAALARFKGDLWLSVNEWNDGALTALGAHRGNLRIDPKQISDEVGRALGLRRADSSLKIESYGTVSLTDIAAEALSAYAGGLAFEGSIEMSPEAAGHLVKRRSIGIFRSKLKSAVRKIFESAGSWTGATWTRKA